MSTAAIEARRATLARLERAAGTAFGYDEGETVVQARRLSPATTLAVATLATTLAATLTYLV